MEYQSELWHHLFKLHLQQQAYQMDIHRMAILLWHYGGFILEDITVYNTKSSVNKKITAICSPFYVET